MDVGIHIGVGILRRLGRRKKIKPDKKDSRRSGQREHESLLLFHSNRFGLPPSAGVVSLSPPEGGTPNYSKITSLGRTRRRKKVGIAAGAKLPCRCRARLRVSQSHRTHIRSKSEQSGKTAATMARLLLYRTSKAKLRSFAWITSQLPLSLWRGPP